MHDVKLAISFLLVPLAGSLVGCSASESMSGMTSAVDVETSCFEDSIDTTDHDPVNPGLQLDCIVSEVDPMAPAKLQLAIPPCVMADAGTPAPGVTQPCWYVRSDPVQCAEYPSKLVFNVHPEVRNVDPGCVIRVQCIVGND